MPDRTQDIPLYHAPTDELREHMLAAATKHGIDPFLLDKMAFMESSYRPNARSKAGARGIMQLMPRTAREMGVKRPFDPRESFEGGAKYLRQLMDRFQGLPDALAAYNAGPTAVVQKRIPKATTDYIGKLLGPAPK